MPLFGWSGWGGGGYGVDDATALLTALAAQQNATTSSALSQDLMSQILQQFTCAAIGIDPGTLNPATGFKAVRVDWPTQGQPAWLQDDDVCFLKITLVPDDYYLIREEDLIPSAGGVVLQRVFYTRVWEANWIFYGPNALARAQQVNSAVLSDLGSDTLAQSGLYEVTDIAEPGRSPELYEGGWWERVNLSMRLNEGVYETFAIEGALSVDVITLSASTTTTVTLP